MWGDRFQWRNRSLVGASLQNILGAHARGWRMSSQQMIKRRTQAEYVTTWRVSLTKNQFRRNIIRRPHEVVVTVIPRHARKPKVDQF